MARVAHLTWCRAAASLTAVLLTAALIPALADASSSRSVSHSRSVRASAASGCRDADTRATRASVGTMRAAVLCLINRVRTSHRLPALHELHRLDHSAQGWTDAMVSHGFFSHGEDFGSRISAAGYSWSSIGENIATGFPTPRTVVRAWMGSTGHCQNILSPSFTDVGTGVSTHAVSGFSSGPATWTQDFGRPAGENAPSGNWGPADSCPY